METITIYVAVDEGYALKPVPAVLVSGGVYKLLQTPDYDPEDEEWHFRPGEIVRCESRRYKEMDYLLAVEKVG